MALNNKMAVIGSAILTPADPTRQALEELLYEVTQKALNDAGLTIKDIDGIVVGSNDQFDGRPISIMMASGSVGGVDRDILSTPSASEHAFVMGALRVATGQYKTQLVVSWSPTEAHSLSVAERLAADPYYHRRLPLDDMASYALQASVLGARVASVHDTAAAFARLLNSRETASLDPKRWPLAKGMTAPPVTSAVAMVIAGEDFVRERKVAKPAWIKGMGWATEPAYLGDRDLATAPALEAAAEWAYREAGVTAPESAFNVAEIFAQTPYQALIALDALGISKSANWSRDVSSGRFAEGGALPLNPGRAGKLVNAVFCNGLMSIADAANQVRGCASSQIAGVKTALAHAASGAAMLYQTVVIFGGQN